MTFLSLSFSILYLPVILKSYKNCYFLRLMSVFFGTANEFMFFCSYTKLSSFQKVVEYSIAMLSKAKRISSLSSLTAWTSKGVACGGGIGFIRSLVESYDVGSVWWASGSAKPNLTIMYVFYRFGLGVSAVSSICLSCPRKVTSLNEGSVSLLKSSHALMVTGFKSLRFNVLGLDFLSFASSYSFAVGILKM